MLRLGVVSFLNARPLVCGLDRRRDVCLVPDVPAALPGRLERGEVDVALLPVVDVLRGCGRYAVVSDACIGCDGETMTVRVLAQVPPDRVRRLAVDPDSHTSVALARVLWRELYDRDLALYRLDPAGPLDTHEAVLLIGDKVVDPRRGSFAYEVDLGGAWRQHTGLPFTFALWARRAGGPRTEAAERLTDGAATRPDGAGTRADGAGIQAAGALLAAARDRGVACAAQIAAADGPRHGWPVELATRYLLRCLRFTLDARSVAGVARFAGACARLGLVPAGARVDWPEALRPRPAGVAP